MDLRNGVSQALTLVLPYIKEQLATGKAPVILGLTGLQGSGKSTWAGEVVEALRTTYQLRAFQVSLDDFYHPHEVLIKLKNRNPDNALLRTRGEPGTHDEKLAQSFFASLRTNQVDIAIPSFDKSAHNGEGDRSPMAAWPKYSGTVDVVVFEGWCVGFTPISVEEIGAKRRRALEVQATQSAQPSLSTLGLHSQKDLEQLNVALSRYCHSFMGPQHLDALIQLDTTYLGNVYSWRLQQEHAMVRRTGAGMRDEEVISFIQGYMPAYELYLDNLRGGFFHRQSGDQKTAKPHVQVPLGPQREILTLKLVG